MGESPFSRSKRVERQRTCSGCRSTAHPKDMIRLSFVSGEIRIEEPGVRRESRGRGMYLHPNETCLNTFFRRRGSLARGLRLEANEVSSEMLSELRSRTFQCIKPEGSGGAFG